MAIKTTKVLNSDISALKASLVLLRGNTKKQIETNQLDKVSYTDGKADGIEFACMCLGIDINDILGI